MVKQPNAAILGRGLAAVAPCEYASDLRAYLCRRLDNPHDVEDVHQDVLLKLVVMDGDALIEKPFGLIHRIANCLLSDFGAACSQYRDHIVSFSEAEDAVERVVDEHTNPSEDVDVDQQIEAALSLLSSKAADILIAVGFEGLTYAEAAEQFGMSVDGIKKSLQRSRALLRREMYNEAGR
jgi:RNA polymerase sigma factor (sigma-70 family)